jgi:hypothetical protein
LRHPALDGENSHQHQGKHNPNPTSYRHAELLGKKWKGRIARDLSLFSFYRPKPSCRFGRFFDFASDQEDTHEGEWGYTGRSQPAECRPCAIVKLNLGRKVPRDRQSEKDNPKSESH